MGENRIKKKVVKVRLSDGLHSKLKAMAKSNELAIIDQTRTYIVNGLREDELKQAENKQVLRSVKDRPAQGDCEKENEAIDE